MANLGVSNFSGVAAGFKNKIINGNFDVWQRGSIFVSPTAGDYLSDRFYVSFVGGTLVLNVGQSAVVPTAAQSGYNSKYSMYISASTAEAAVGANEYCVIGQNIEGNIYQGIKDKTCTLSFWVKSDTAGIYCVTFRMGDLSYSYVAEYTITTANVWQKIEIPVTFDQAATSEELSIDSGMSIGWTQMCGSTFHTTKDVWQAGNFLATSNQVNCLDTITEYFILHKIQFEVGSVATPFDNRSIQDELALCERYFQTTQTNLLGSSYAASCFISNQVLYNTRMRDTPTIVETTAWSYAGGGASGTIDVITSKGLRAHFQSGATTGYNEASVVWSADAEIP